MTDDLEAALAAMASQYRQELPDRHLLERILASRSSGRRIALSLSNAAHSRWPRRLSRAALVAAALAIIVGGVRMLHRPPGADDTSQPIAGIDLWMAGDFAFAQGTGALHEEYAPLALDTARLRPHRLTWVKRMFADDSLIQVDTSSLELTRAVAPRNEWMAVMSNALHEPTFTGMHAETLWVDAGSLAPHQERIGYSMGDESSTHTSMVLRDTVVQIELRSRNVTHHINGANGRQTDTTFWRLDTTVNMPSTRYPVGLLPGPGQLVLVMAARLDAETAATFLLEAPLELRLTEHGAPVTMIPVNIKVAGRRTVTTPAGRWECWVVHGGIGDRQTSLVRISDGVLVSAYVTDRWRGTRYRAERELVAESDP